MEELRCRFFGDGEGEVVAAAAGGDGVIFWVVDICDMNVVGEKCVWLQNKARIDTHNNTVMML